MQLYSEWDVNVNVLMYIGVCSIVCQAELASQPEKKFLFIPHPLLTVVLVDVYHYIYSMFWHLLILASIDKSSGSQKLSLKVVAGDFDGSYSVESRTVGVPFVPAFSVSHASVTLTQSEKVAKVVVMGTPEQLKQLTVSMCRHLM